MNELQRRLARHALGLPNKSGVSYRNRYACGPGLANRAWRDLIAKGLANGVEALRSDGRDSFWLLEAGARLALGPGERLDDEDFPSSVKEKEIAK
jgi:hypothetical protein